MRLVINGQDQELESSHTVAELLEHLEITGAHIAVAVNLQVVPRAQYAQTSLHDGDKIEIVHAVGGGSTGALRSRP
ncbi:MAG: sulfur carrier protein ThiS [Nitrospinaceae bacterium]